MLFYRSVGLTKSRFASLGTFCFVKRPFCLLPLDWVRRAIGIYRKQGSNIPKRTPITGERPTMKNYWTQNVNSFEVEKPWSN